MRSLGWALKSPEHKKLEDIFQHSKGSWNGIVGYIFKTLSFNLIHFLEVKWII